MPETVIQDQTLAMAGFLFFPTSMVLELIETHKIKVKNYFATKGVCGLLLWLLRTNIIAF